MSKKNKNRSGFTIVELIIAGSLFIIIISIASASFVESIKVQRQLSTLVDANNNTVQALEQIAREVRTGTDFEESTSNVLHFQNFKNEWVAYKLLDNSITKCVGSERECLSAPAARFIPITADNVSIEKLDFFYKGLDPAENWPVRVTIGTQVVSILEIDANLQTTISTRNLREDEE
ncbi:MAG: hypothetical protein HYS87_00250 [Candidatus Colwellbacteria bacterium]|nr:hypothetical protein [Candidatus Colwellbacteria bacterium]